MKVQLFGFKDFCAKYDYGIYGKMTKGQAFYDYFFQRVTTDKHRQLCHVVYEVPDTEFDKFISENFIV